MRLTLSSTDGVDDFVICAPALQHASLWSRPLDVLTIGPSSSNPARACMLRLSRFTTDAQRPDLISSCAVCSRPVGHLRCINPILNRVWYGRASRSDNGLPYAVEDPLSRYIFSSARPSMHADSVQMEAVFAAYRVFSFWRISWRSSVTPMVSTTSLGHANTSIL